MEYASSRRMGIGHDVHEIRCLPELEGPLHGTLKALLVRLDPMTRGDAR